MQIADLLKYQPEVIDLLQRAKSKNRLSHAYIFEGESGSGTVEAAEYFAMMLLCNEENAPCLKCNTCERIMYNSHMSVVMLEPINGMITKPQVESLIHDFNYTTIEGTANIYIIKDADKMNEFAVNALLKMIEEPAPNHYVILTTTNHNNILPTIVSRCQFIHFNAPNQNLVEEHLVKNNIKNEIAYAVSYMTLDFDEALNLANDPTFIKLFDLAKLFVSLKYKKKDTFVEYYLNKDFILNLDNKFHFMFFELLIIFNKEILYSIKGIKNHSDELINDLNFKSIKEEEVLSNIDIINKYEIRLNSFANLDLTYCSLFCEF